MTKNFYDDYSKKFAKNDFWRQVKRTISGEPVSQEQINMIVSEISKNLELNKDDRLLDIGCGNGALTQYFFTQIKASIGVDASSYLIEVAKGFFEKEGFLFVNSDAIEFMQNQEEKVLNEITKVLSYGVFHFLSDEEVGFLINFIFNKMHNASSLYIGSCPDKNRYINFYEEEKSAILLDDISSAIGKWRTFDFFEKISEQNNLVCKKITMPKEFHASHYRFDVLISR